MDVLKDTTVIIVTYNHQDFIENCLNSVLNQGAMEVVVVDNNSHDDTAQIIQNNFPQVKLILNPNNGGYSVGLNIGVKNSSGKYLFLLNPDTIVEKNAIQELINPLKENEKIITTPKILLYDGSKVNTCGNVIHFTGLAFTRGLNSDPLEFTGPEEVHGLSGACFAITRENYRSLGGFNENFFMYMEDTSFSWRASLFGFRILYIPTSIIRHDYTLNVGAQKLYYLEKGRYIILRKYLTRKERLKIAPSLMMTEILTWGYSGLSGIDGIKYKSKAVKDGLRVDVIKMESEGKDLIRSMDWEIPEGQLMYNSASKALKKVANWVYRKNYNSITKK